LLKTVDAGTCEVSVGRERANRAFLIPRCLAIFIAQALSQDHFVESGPAHRRWRDRSARPQGRSLIRVSYLTTPTTPHLEAEVAQGGTQVVLDGNGLRLKQLAMAQQHPKMHNRGRSQCDSLSSLSLGNREHG
jgi:hypothetical protein